MGDTQCSLRQYIKLIGIDEFLLQEKMFFQCLHEIYEGKKLRIRKMELRIKKKERKKEGHLGGLVG